MCKEDIWESVLYLGGQWMWSKGSSWLWATEMTVSCKIPVLSVSQNSQWNHQFQNCKLSRTFLSLRYPALSLKQWTRLLSTLAIQWEATFLLRTHVVLDSGSGWQTWGYHWYRKKLIMYAFGKVMQILLSLFIAFLQFNCLNGYLLLISLIVL